MLNNTALSTAEITFPEKLKFLLMAKARYKVAYGGRGGAKSHSFCRAILVLMMQNPLRVLCAREYQNSLADSAYKLFVDLIRDYDLEGSFFEILHDSIRAINGGEIRFMGIMTNPTKIKSFEGIDIAYIMEAAKISKEAMLILTPTIRKSGSEIWIEFNPESADDYIYQTFVTAAVKPARSIVVEINYLDNPWFPEELREEMEHMKATDYDMYLHVYMGKTMRVLTGAVYADEMRQAIAENRITSVPWDPRVPVQTFWDLGFSDHTAIWFVQKVGLNYHVIDYYANRLKSLRFYIQHLRSKEYNYALNWFPHDADYKDIKTGLSVIELMRTAGFNCKLVPNLKIADGLNAARDVFPRCYFDAVKTKSGVDALCEYHWDDNAPQKKKPVHDASSHGSDGFRYFGVAMEKGVALLTGRSTDPERGLESLRSPIVSTYSGGAGEAWMGH